MTRSVKEITDHFNNQAVTKISSLNIMGAAFINKHKEALSLNFDKIFKLMEFDQAELTIHRRIEAIFREGIMTNEILTAALKELDELRSELIEHAKTEMEVLGKLLKDI